MEKKKILMISDHALSVSGVGCQSRYLIDGLIKKGCWSFRQLGAAIKHDSHDVVHVNDDFIIKPIDGFGNRDLLRVVLASERPDALLIFTDPRFFIWLFEMEDEVHQICPILWWHVWDNMPIPTFNRVLYEATDQINCISHPTYEICSSMFPEKTKFVPHSLPSDIIYPMDESDIVRHKREMLGERADRFTLLWINRNAKRKRPADVLLSWKLFCDRVQAEFNHRNVLLLMHTDPLDEEGPNLLACSEHLGILDTVTFSKERTDFNLINLLHNISDACINISFAEGFGLGTLEAMQVGRPIIVVKTGGMTRQVLDYRDESENGVALPVELKTLVGSQGVPYIYEDYVSCETVADGIMRLYKIGHEERRKIGLKARNYVRDVYSYQSTIDTWHDSLTDTINTWRENRHRIHNIEM